MQCSLRDLSAVDECHRHDAVAWLHKGRAGSVCRFIKFFDDCVEPLVILHAQPFSVLFPYLILHLELHVALQRDVSASAVATDVAELFEPVSLPILYSKQAEESLLGRRVEEVGSEHAVIVLVVLALAVAAKEVCQAARLELIGRELTNRLIWHALIV